MASLYKKDRSPFWFFQYTDANGTRHNKSTKLRTDDPGETAKARALRAQLEAKEFDRQANEQDSGDWDSWVPQYFGVLSKHPLRDNGEIEGQDLKA